MRAAQVRATSFGSGKVFAVAAGAAVSVLALLGVASPAHAAQGQITLVTYRNMPAPGLAGRVIWTVNTNGNPVIDNSGRLFLHATLRQNGESAGDALFFGPPGGLTPVLTSPAPAPGIAPALNTAGLSGLVSLSGDSNSTFFGTLRQGVGGVTAANDGVLWTGVPNAPVIAARDGQAVPSLFGVQFGAINPAAEAFKNGRTAFMSSLTGAVSGTDDNALFLRSAGGTYEVLVREGSPAPGYTFGEVFSQFGAVVRVNANGVAVVPGTVSGGAVDQYTSNAIWSGTPNNLQLLARRGGQAPGFDPGIEFYRFTSGIDSGTPLSLNGANTVVFTAPVDVPGVDSVLNSDAVFVGDATNPATLTTLLRDGDDFLDVLGVVYAGFGSVLVNGNGQMVIYVDNLHGPGVFGNADDTALVRYTPGAPGSFQKIVREGDPVADLPGVTFGSMPGTLAINNDGDVIFSATLIGAGISTSNNRGLFLAAPGQNPVLLLQTGTTIQVAGVTRMITAFAYYGGNAGEDSGHFGFNNRDELAVRLTLDGGASDAIAIITLGESCRADFDNQNGVQVADIFAFLRAWFAQDPRANFDGQGGIQVADIFAFLRAWFAGCP